MANKKKFRPHKHENLNRKPINFLDAWCLELKRRSRAHAERTVGVAVLQNMRQWRLDMQGVGGSSSALNQENTMKRDMHEEEIRLEGMVDCHCHSKDSFNGLDEERVVNAISNLKVGKITSRLLDRLPHKVLAGFGLHPWYAHVVRLEEGEDYDDLFPKLEAEGRWIKPYLPPRIDLLTLIAQLRQRLLEVPNSILGEVGLDKAFGIRITNEKGRTVRLTRVKVPIEHQIKVLEAQLDLAVELGRNVSFHGVRCTAEIVKVIEKLKERWGQKLTGSPPVIKLPGDDQEVHERGIRIVWHSASISVADLKKVLKKLPTIMYFSYAIFHFETELETLDELIWNTPDDRLLIETDWDGDPGVIDAKLEMMIRRVMVVKGWGMETCLARLERNWSEYSGSENNRK